MKKEKIKYNKEIFSMLESVRNEKFDEIVAVLDLFQGELSLDDILNKDIPLIDSLKYAKIRRNEKLFKEREKARANAKNREKNL